uniref:RIKEN cDNA 1700030J22 gene n=1 Tax=Nannospalax galili TaxID=1026970 RepID=A0A8C6RGT6_NANGA
MDLCQKNETDIENNESKKIQGTEETELTLTCLDKRSEKNHVCCLLRVSDLTLEEDKGASEFTIGTGWEEAVHGWGRTSATACIWSRKKVKLGRLGDGTCHGSCLVCVSLAQGSLEAQFLSEVGKSDVGAAAEMGPKRWSGPSQAPSTASRDPHKLCFPTCVHGGKESLQIKEFIWCMEDWGVPETVNGKAPGNPSRGTDRRLLTLGSMTSKALVVLPPLKTSPPNNLEVLDKKSKNVVWWSEQKVPRAEECAACADGSKIVDTVGGKGEKRPFELASHLKATDMLPLSSPAVRTPLLAESQKCCLHWSLLPKKNSVCPPNPVSTHCLAALNGIQNCRASKLKHILTETVENKMFPKPLLPSLTVSRVVIPISTHRFF